MKYLLSTIQAIFDPITTAITKIFPEKLHAFISKHIIIQIVLALLITLFILLIVRL